MRGCPSLCEPASVPGDPFQALEVLRRAGLRHREVLGSGMEGTVVDLGDGTVAKVWSGRNMADLLRLREFHDAVLDGHRGAIDITKVEDPGHRNGGGARDPRPS